MSDIVLAPNHLGSGGDDQQWGPSAPLHEHEQRNLDTVALVVPCWNRHDVPAILSHYDEEITWRNVAMGETYVGKQRVGAFLDDLFQAVPDLTMTITMRVARGDFVAEEYTIRGTHLGTLFGIPPTGRSLELSAVSFVEFRDGKLKEDHFYFDVATAMRQMGYFPESSAAYKLPGRVVLGLVSRVLRRRSR
jgi:steroid delta-isomerase-like uncharacterized protein